MIKTSFINDLKTASRGDRPLSLAMNSGYGFPYGDVEEGIYYQLVKEIGEGGDPEKVLNKYVALYEQLIG